MRTIKALSLTQNVNHWLANTRQSRVLHVFDNACNLINERKEILSIVTSQIGNGPFNLVTSDITFTDHLDVKSGISIRSDQLHVGDLLINMADVNIWNPRPDWDLLHRKKEDVLGRLKPLVPNVQPALPASLLSTMATSIVANNISSSVNTAQQLSGLGQGLTPSGDDFIMGALYATWIIHPLKVAGELAKEVAETAAPLTTSLSVAWIRSAGRGEAGGVWHHLFHALINGDKVRMQESIDGILAVGETSGADALAGFIGVCSAAKERMYNK